MSNSKTGVVLFCFWNDYCSPGEYWRTCTCTWSCSMHILYTTCIYTYTYHIYIYVILVYGPTVSLILMHGCTTATPNPDCMDLHGVAFPVWLSVYLQTCLICSCIHRAGKPCLGCSSVKIHLMILRAWTIWLSGLRFEPCLNARLWYTETCHVQSASALWFQ